MLKQALAGQVDADGFLRVGHIPAGTPVNLLANVNPDMSFPDMAALLIDLKRTLLEVKLKNLEGEAARQVMKERLAPTLLKVSMCPDFIEDRGHLFGTELPDSDKLALIEYLKTF